MKSPKFVVGHLMDDQLFVKSVKIPKPLDWIKQLGSEELVEFFGEFLKLVTHISEGKENSETLEEFLAYWREIASEMEDYEENDTENYESFFKSLADSLGTALINSGGDVLANIAEAEQELDSPWIDIVDVQHEQDPLFHNIYMEPEIADVTEQQRDHYLTLSISELRLPTRAHNCLEKANIYTLRALVEKTEEELLLLSNFGMVSLQTVKAGLAPMGLYLGMDLDPEEINEDEDYD